MNNIPDNVKYYKVKFKLAGMTFNTFVARIYEQQFSGFDFPMTRIEMFDEREHDWVSCSWNPTQDHTNFPYKEMTEKEVNLYLMAHELKR